LAVVSSASLRKEWRESVAARKAKHIIHKIAMKIFLYDLSSGWRESPKERGEQAKDRTETESIIELK